MMKKIGRPTTIPKAKIINVNLGAEHIELAKKLGQGNISKGIRVALEFADKQKEKHEPI